MSALVVVLVVAVIALVFFVFLLARKPSGSRRTAHYKALAHAHEMFLRRLHSSALAHAQVDPYAQVVLDDLAQHTQHIHNEIEET